MLKICRTSVALFAVLLLATTACRDTDIVTPDASVTRAAPSPAEQRTAPSAAVHPGRALAANCFQCHGTNGEASELKIAGIGASALQEKFAEMRAEHPGRNIMNVHARAYTHAQINLIGDYFSKQEY